jgi:hypothetical protein
MIMNAAFLIERDRESEFDLKGERDRLEVRRQTLVQVHRTWPPYNFVHIRLKLERGEATPEAVAAEQMFLIDDLLLAPVNGFKFILGQVQKMADRS